MTLLQLTGLVVSVCVFLIVMHMLLREQKEEILNENIKLWVVYRDGVGVIEGRDDDEEPVRENEPLDTHEEKLRGE